MIALLQRVTRASVTVEGRLVSSIGSGMLVLLGVAKGDDELSMQKLASKVARYRIFPEPNGPRPIHASLQDVDGEVLVVSQFTLCADTRRGLRPGFEPAADPALAERLYEAFCEELSAAGCRRVERGVFGARMEVELINEGPVTIWLEQPPTGG